MSKSKMLFNINRLIDGKEDTSPEVSFLHDFDYTSRQLNSHTSYYYYKEITKEANPEYFETKDKPVHVVVLDTLPEKCEIKESYDQQPILYHTNDQKYYIIKHYDGKPSRRYKPSSLNCIRNMYYQIIGADLDKQQQKSSDFFGICESGTDRHKRIQFVITQMKNYGIDCEYIDVGSFIKNNNLTNLRVEGNSDYETKVYDFERNIIFLCDGLILYKGVYYVLEIKTESSYKWMDRSYVDEKHLNQAYTYALELGIDKVLFIYENRDVCTKKPYILTVTDDNKKYIENRIHSCDEYVSQNIVPPVEEHITPKICQYCDYKARCKVDGRK